MLSEHLQLQAVLVHPWLPFVAVSIPGRLCNLLPRKHRVRILYATSARTDLLHFPQAFDVHQQVQVMLAWSTVLWLLAITQSLHIAGELAQAPSGNVQVQAYTVQATRVLHAGAPVSSCLLLSSYLTKDLCAQNAVPLQSSFTCVP